MSIYIEACVLRWTPGRQRAQFEAAEKLHAVSDPGSTLVPREGRGNPNQTLHTV